ncbi:MAG TPA: hypothetical protein ENK48_08315 [Gammaproteobacteria bacterium]|nr:hypothetical protein [Gammaproteobacteria bacterium]
MRHLYPAAAIVLFCFPIAAQALTGNEFLLRCKDVNHAKKGRETIQEVVDRALDAGSCAGYVGGVINGINLVGNMLRQQKAMKKNFICLPQGMQASALVKQMVEYLEKNPKTLKAPVSLHIYNHFARSYPCK